MVQGPRIREGNDRAFRRLFAHPEVVADLLRGFAPPPVVRRFDRASLRPLPDDRVDSSYNRRASDTTWGFSLEGGSGVAMIFEAQSTEDRAMAGRMTVQVGMFCEHLQRTRPGEPLPAVLPVVFYTGRAPWRAERSLAGRASREAGLLTYFADSCYLLLEVGALATGPLPEGNLVSVVVRMEAARGASELIGVLESEKEFLLGRDPGLWTEYFVWAREVLAPLKIPDADMNRFESLKEGMDMIAERILEEIEEHREEGRAEETRPRPRESAGIAARADCAQVRGRDRRGVVEAPAGARGRRTPAETERAGDRLRNGRGIPEQALN